MFNHYKLDKISNPGIREPLIIWYWGFHKKVPAATCALRD